MEALILLGKLENLGRIRQYVKSAATEAGLEKKVSYKLCLAVDEIATNIITHGYNENGLEGSISVEAKIDETSLTVYIEDTAKPYDPTTKEALTEEDLKKRMEERPLGGYGIHLAYQSVDKFIYEHIGDRNRNILVVNRTTT
ncbi:ATP-binding protein [Hydrocoleum sp. CS-953]|uniref:ATP-binding protein n=1 Tax=Microcoleaceae TaxID=1892252 RepID=UPI000B9AA64A|nr:ATP-binding protein [Hydrocoleum sp. CS-953]OZH55396.1 anti-sigma regulatory factor [Hydrocoleum sp. CS-953]OZH55524.1 anti-sigma regulatory factor [Hydrocoleum sp. CS-953]